MGMVGGEVDCQGHKELFVAMESMVVVNIATHFLVFKLNAKIGYVCFI